MSKGFPHDDQSEKRQQPKGRAASPVTRMNVMEQCHLSHDEPGGRSAVSPLSDTSQSQNDKQFRTTSITYS